MGGGSNNNNSGGDNWAADFGDFGNANDNTFGNNGASNGDLLGGSTSNGNNKVSNNNSSSDNGGVKFLAKSQFDTNADLSAFKLAAPSNAPIVYDPELHKKKKKNDFDNDNDALPFNN